MNIGIIGIGRMGAGMAANLLSAGCDVTVHNRTPEKSAALFGQGAHVAVTIAEAETHDDREGDQNAHAACGPLGWGHSL